MRHIIDVMYCKTQFSNPVFVCFGSVICIRFSYCASGPTCRDIVMACDMMTSPDYRRHRCVCSAVGAPNSTLRALFSPIYLDDRIESFARVSACPVCFDPFATRPSHRGVRGTDPGAVGGKMVKNHFLPIYRGAKAPSGRSCAQPEWGL